MAREKFPEASVADALERAIRNSRHLLVRDAALVAAARALARKIDAWDVIVEWAIEDSAGIGRPAVPANDNVSIPSFLRHLEAMRLTPAKAESPGARKPPPAPDELAEFRARFGVA